MELVDGVTFEKYVKQEQPRPTRILTLVAEVSYALHYAHEQGVVHRDMKPSNILITGNEHPKLVDFGLAKAMFRTDLDSDPSESISGAVVGTPLFMAPEQARGEDAQQDGRTDIYALAIIVYVMLLRRHPHKIDHGNQIATIRAIAGGYVRPPSEVHPKFNKSLERIIMKALAVDPNHRYANATEFGDAIHTFLDERAASRANT
jgi:serine/threonine protein kinase